jgi:Tol biopolymer transport system component
MVRPRHAWLRAMPIAVAVLAIVAGEAAATTIAYIVHTPGVGGASRSAIRLMNIETGETRILVEFERASGLDASADGRRLVCTTGKRANTHLTLIDARTGAFERLRREHELGVYNVPRFSPSGDELLYNYAQPAGAAYAVKLLDLRTRNSTWLTPRGFKAWEPDWSPDGSQIVLVKNDPRKLYRDLHVMPAEGGEARNLTFWLEHDEEPAWSPDGREIAFMRVSKLGRRVATYDVASGDVRELTDHTFEAFRPSWSPDGQHIVFSGATVEERDRGRDTWNVYTMRRDGTDMLRLTRHEPAWAVDPVWVDADLLPVAPRGAVPTGWAALKQQVGP